MRVLNYVLFRFKPHVSEAEIEQFRRENQSLAQKLGAIGVEAVCCERIIPGAPEVINKGYQVASATFLKDEAALQAFRTAPEHQAIVAAHKALLDDICATQIKLP